MENRLAVGLLTTIGFFGFYSAHAQYGQCVRPNIPELPGNLLSEADTQATSANVQVFFELSATYTKCLSDYAAANMSNMSEAEKSALKEEYENSVTRFRKTTEKWNKIYGKYLEKKNENS